MKAVLVLFIYSFFSLGAYSSEGDTIVLAAGLTTEPYVMEAEDSGFEIDIVREIFEKEGYCVKFLYQPLLRTKVSFKNGLVDGVMTIKRSYSEVRNSFISDEYIIYYNFAVTLQSRNIELPNVLSMKGKKVESFQQASFSLGDEFELMAKNNPDYLEIANQRSQIAKFFAGRSDVIVLDKRIFKYHRKQLNDSAGVMEESTSYDKLIKYHDLFEPSRFRLAFKNDRLRDLFNKGLIDIKKSGRYEQIIESYLGD